MICAQLGIMNNIQLLKMKMSIGQILRQFHIVITARNSSPYNILLLLRLGLKFRGPCY